MGGNEDLRAAREVEGALALLLLPLPLPLLLLLLYCEKPPRPINAEKRRLPLGLGERVWWREAPSRREWAAMAEVSIRLEEGCASEETKR
jgi:hypothetical protein